MKIQYFWLFLFFVCDILKDSEKERGKDMLPKLSVKKPYTIVVAVVLVIILGFVSFSNMTVDLLPSMNLPYAIVFTTYPGASPEEVEQTVTRPIEQSMATISNIHNVSSTSSENVSTVVLEFTETANMDSATIEMRESLDQISGYWPETVGNPMIMKLNPDMMPVMVAAVSAKGNESKMTSDMIQEKIIPEIESVEGVASVAESGSIEETVEVTVNPDKIKDLNKDMKESLNSQFSEAESALSVAKAKVESGKAQMAKGQKEAAEQMGKAEAELSKKNAELTQGQLEIQAKLSELNLAQAQLTAQKTELATKEATLKAQKDTFDQLQKIREQLEAAYDELVQQIEEQGKLPELVEKLEELKKQIEENSKLLAAFDKTREEMAQGLAAIQEAKAKISAAEGQITEGKKALEILKKQLNQGAISLAEARGQMSSAQIQAAAGLGTAGVQLALGEQALKQGETELKNAKEQAYEKADLNGILNAEMVKTLLAAQNFNMPAGYVKEEGVDYLIRVGNKFKDIEELKNLVLVSMEDMDPILLSDVADVVQVDNSDEVYAKINGESGIMLSIQKQTGYSTGEVSDRILDKFEELKKEYEGVHFVTLMDQGVYIDLIVNSVLQNLLLGAVLAILILLVFLKSVRSTFVIACSIPISLLAAIVMMYFSGVTLNVISLSGLALGVGMLVDNSIVVIENIYRMRNEEGASAKKAAIEGAKQVSGAIAASTLTTVCVFAPIVFTQGITRQLFVDMGLTIAYSLLASLIVALSLVPMMSAGLLRKTEEKRGRFIDKLQDIYAITLRKALHWKALVLVLTLGLLVLGGALALSRGTAFMPEMESTQISLNLTMEKGTPLTETAKEADKVMDKLLKIDDIDEVGAMASGGNAMGTTSGNQIQMYAILKEDKKLSNDELKKKIEEDTKDCKGELLISMSTMDMSALGSSGVVVQVKGRELDTLQKVAKDVAGILKDTKGTQNISDGMGETTGELRIVVDKKKAMEHNLTVAQVFQKISAKVAAVTSSTALSTDVKDYDILVLDKKNESLTREDIRNMIITAEKQDGTTEEIALKDIVTFEDAIGLQSINRNSQTRFINVTAEIQEGDNIGLVSNRVKEALEDYKVPAGYSIEMAGEDETIMEAMTELLKMLGLAVVFMYLIMVAQFQSLRSPFIIMFTIPLAFTGGLFGLYVTGSPISVIAMIGFVMLSGIIVNNGIVFVDYTNQLINAGMEKKEALVTAGKTRLRPILMTALTTILGLSTMALGFGTGADMVQPMAVVTVGGLIYGTVLTLYVVPCIFDLFHGKEKARLRDGIENEKEGEELENGCRRKKKASQETDERRREI